MSLQIVPPPTPAFAAVEEPATDSAVRVAKPQVPVTLHPDTVGDDSHYLVSALVSTYKAKRFIRGCLEDLEAQTISERLEIVVVDSGSKQNERAIVEEFQQRYSNIVYIRTEERESVYAAWNQGIRATRGKYITNANTNDRHRQDTFEHMVGLLENQPDVALAYGNTYITKTENETFDNATCVGELRRYDFDSMKLVNTCFIGPQPMWRKSVHTRYGYFDESFESAGDWEFWLRMAGTERFSHLEEYLELYLESPTSVVHRGSGLSEREAVRVHERYRRRIAPL